MKCKNCDEDLYGPQLYCAKCGQKNISKLNLRYLFSEIIDNVINLDSKLYKTLKVLILKPGVLSSEFTKGRRKSYVVPVRLYVVVTLILFFLLPIVRSVSQDQKEGSFLAKDHTLEFTIEDSVWVIKYEDYERWENTMGLEAYLKDSVNVQDPTERWITFKMIRNGFNPEIGVEMVDRLSIFLLLFIPFIAFIYKLSFVYNKFGYIDHLVFNLHFNSFIIMLIIVYKLFTLLIDVDYGIIIIFIGIVVYLYVAIIRFYKRKWWVALYKLLVLAIGYSILSFIFVTIWFLSSMVMI